MLKSERSEYYYDQLPSDLVRRENNLARSVLFYARISKSLHKVKSIKIMPRDDPCAYRCWSESYWKLYKICF